MNRMYMKQNGGTLPTGPPVMSLNPSLFGLNPLESMEHQPITKRENGCSLKTDGHSGSLNKVRGENASHSDTSTASAITPITPSQLKGTGNGGNILQIPLMAQNVAQNVKRNGNLNGNLNGTLGGTLLPQLPPPIPFGLSNVNSNATATSNGSNGSDTTSSSSPQSPTSGTNDGADGRLSNVSSSRTSSASTNSSVPTLMTPLSPNRNGNNMGNGQGANQQNVQNQGQTQNMSDPMVQLTSVQYGQLIQKIDHLEHTQMQQRQVIACLAGKLQDLEYKNQSNHLVATNNPNLTPNTNCNLNPSVPPIPQLPPIVPMQPQQQPVRYTLCGFQSISDGD